MYLIGKQRRNGTAIQEKRNIFLAPFVTPAAWHTLTWPSLTPLDEQVKAVELNTILKSIPLFH